METSKQNQQYGYKVVLDRSGERKLFISVSRETGDDLEIFNEFPPSTGEVAAQLVFGGCGFEQAARARMSGAKWPVLWAQGDVCPGTHLSGTQVFIVEGQSIRQVMIGDQVVGSAWSDEDADYCLLTGVLPANPGDARGCQTTSCMQQIEVALHQAGMNFSNIVRTWFYLDHLLDWYDEFNAARTKIEARLSETMSTGADNESVGSRLGHQTVTDLKSIIGIAEKFSFINELFGGDPHAYEKAIIQLNGATSLTEAEEYLGTLRLNHKWPADSSQSVLLIEIIRRKFGA